MAPRRVLILTADIGAGHDLPAQLLAEAIRGARADADIRSSTGSRRWGRAAGASARSGQRVRARAVARGCSTSQYWFIARFRPTRRLGGVWRWRSAARGLRALIAPRHPDVIVSTYPGTTEVLGRLKRAGVLAVPCVSRDHRPRRPRLLGASRHRPSPDHPCRVARGGRRDRRARARTSGMCAASRGRVRRTARPRRGARGARPAGGGTPVVVVSGGGWGVGDLERAARTALGGPAARQRCACAAATPGSAARLEPRSPASRVCGWRASPTRMCEWLAAADVLVHSTAGLTVLEARSAGRGRSPTAGASGTSASTTAPTAAWGSPTSPRRAELAAALRRALAAPRRRASTSPRSRPPPTRCSSSRAGGDRRQPADRRRRAEHERAAEDQRQPGEDHAAASGVVLQRSPTSSGARITGSAVSRAKRRAATRAAMVALQRAPCRRPAPGPATARGGRAPAQRAGPVAGRSASASSLLVSPRRANAQPAAITERRRGGAPRARATGRRRPARARRARTRASPRRHAALARRGGPGEQAEARRRSPRPRRGRAAGPARRAAGRRGRAAGPARAPASAGRPSAARARARRSAAASRGSPAPSPPASAGDARSPRSSPAPTRALPSARASTACSATAPSKHAAAAAASAIPPASSAALMGRAIIARVRTARRAAAGHRRRLDASRRWRRSCPPLAAALRHPDALSAPGHVALTFDDGPHPQGTPAVLDVARRRRRAARRSSSSASRCGATGAGAPRSSPPATRSRVHGDRHRNLLRLAPRALARRPRPRRRRDRRGDRRRAGAAPRAVRDLLAGRRCARSARAAGRRALVALGPRLDARGATPRVVARDGRRRHRGGDVLLLHDADDYSAPGSWRATAAALPRVLDAVAAAGLRPARRRCRRPRSAGR